MESDVPESIHRSRFRYTTQWINSVSNHFGADRDGDEMDSSSSSTVSHPCHRNRRPGESNESQTASPERRSGAWKTLFIVVGTVAALFFVCYLPSKEPPVNHHVTIVLLGNTGSGKSATGNSILGRTAFRVDASPLSVTTHCEKQSALYGGTGITVIDTPGLTDQMRPKVMECVDVLEPHILLLVVRLGRFTEEERNAVQWIHSSFGERAPSFTIVVFTHLDQLKGKSVETFLSSSPEIQRLISSFGGGYHAIDNEHRNDEQVTQLLKKIDALCHKTWGHAFTRKILEKMKTTEEKKVEEGKQLKEESEEMVCVQKQAKDAIDHKDHNAHKQTSAASQQLKEEQEKIIQAEKEVEDARKRTDDAIKKAYEAHEEVKMEMEQRIQAEKRAENARKRTDDAIKLSHDAAEQLRKEREKRIRVEQRAEDARKWAEYADERANAAVAHLEEKWEKIMRVEKEAWDERRRAQDAETRANEASGRLHERWERVVSAERQAGDAQKWAEYAAKLAHETLKQLKEEEENKRLIVENKAADVKQKLEDAESSGFWSAMKFVLLAVVILVVIAVYPDITKSR